MRKGLPCHDAIMKPLGRVRYGQSKQPKPQYPDCVLWFVCSVGKRSAYEACWHFAAYMILKTEIQMTWRHRFWANGSAVSLWNPVDAAIGRKFTVMPNMANVRLSIYSNIGLFIGKIKAQDDLSVHQRSALALLMRTVRLLIHVTCVTVVITIIVINNHFDCHAVFNLDRHRPTRYVPLSSYLTTTPLFP